MRNTPIPVGVFFEGVTVEQQILLEGPMLEELARALGPGNWAYSDWKEGYVTLELTFELEGERDMPALESTIAKAMYAWTTVLAGVIAHPHAQIVSWPTEHEVRAHMEDSRNEISNPTITWVE